MIKAVLFDFDDTLAKTKEIRYKALKEAGKVFYNLEISDKDVDKHWGKPFNPFISGVLREAEPAEQLTEKYKSILHKYPNEPFPNTLETLQILSKKYLLGIISSSNPALILSGIENVGINPDLFFYIQSSDDTTFHKPDREVFKPTLEKLKARGVGKPEIIYIGDALDDFIAASNAGIHFCGIANRTVNENVFIQKNIPYIGNINSLPSYILKI